MYTACYPLYTTGKNNHLNNSPGGPTRQAIALEEDNNPCAVQACAEPCCNTDDLALRTVPHDLPYKKCS